MTPERQVHELADSIQRTDPAWHERAWERLDSLTKPPRSLGRLEALAAKAAIVQRTVTPSAEAKLVVLMAGDHGVTAQGVSPYPSEVTAQMVANFAAGGAAISQLARWCDADLALVDVGVASDLPDLPGLMREKIAYGTADMTQGPAMTIEQASRAVLVGARLAGEAARRGVTLIGTGEMGIGNSTAAAALAAVLCGREPDEVVGPGTGLDADGVARKVDAVRRALGVNAPDPGHPLATLAAVGGLEIAGLAGVVLGAAAAGVCVVADGFISGSAALVATSLAPEARDYLFASHRSAEPGHAHVLRALDLQPVLELDMRLGEGSGAALAMGLIDAACRVMSGMRTFAEAGVAEAGE
ncbi:MAG TPA: nicotinate-nucleotide--dimethylbenzimidazole phosphoribosyltransferase [Coriobacteriia bacterium]|jgi:nicotinate-nucleotide--dimethylbenzimidazole phosphoribosyltransferase